MDTSFHSIQSSYSTESKPQSIVHHIIRLESKVGKKVKKMFASKKNSDSKKSIGTASTKGSSLSASMASMSLTQSFHLESEAEASLSSSCSSSFLEESSVCSSFQGSMDVSLDGSLDLEWDFQTIDQNTFITQVLMDTLSETNYVIHFFSEDTLEYFDYEDKLTQIIVNSASKEYELYRMSSQMAPLFTAKLNINPEHSVLIHVVKGKVVSRLDDLSNPENREQVKEWLREAGSQKGFAGARHPLS